MLPTLIDGPLPVHTYGLMVTAAFCAAFLYIHIRVQRIGIMPDRMLGTYLAAAAGGLLGARVFYSVFTQWSTFIANPLSVFVPTTGGFAIYGGLIGGFAAVAGYIVWKGLPLFKLGDIIWPAVILGMGIGRLGCFFAGCCHGAVAPHFDGGTSIGLPNGEVWLSSTFPFLTTEFHEGGVSRLLDVPLYPTQLWAVASAVLVAGLLTWLWERRSFDGQILAIGLLLEPPTRILTEMFRADHRGYLFTFPVNETLAAWFPGLTEAGGALEGATMGITSSQAVAMMFMLGGLAIYLVQRHQGVAEETPLDVGQDDLLLAADIPD